MSLTPEPDDEALLRWAEQHAWSDDGAGIGLPTVLTRPPVDGAVGTLDYSEPDDPKSPACRGREALRKLTGDVA